MGKKIKCIFLFMVNFCEKKQRRHIFLNVKIFSKVAKCLKHHIYCSINFLQTELVKNKKFVLKFIKHPNLF